MIVVAFGTVAYVVMTALTARLLYQAEDYHNGVEDLDVVASCLAGLLWPIVVPLFALMWLYSKTLHRVLRRIVGA